MSATVIQGDDLTFKILVKKSGSCYDLTNVTGATLKIPLAAGGESSLILTAGLTIPTPINGEIVVDISDTLSTTLKLGKLNLELILDESSQFQTLQFQQGLEVKARLY